MYEDIKIAYFSMEKGYFYQKLDSTGTQVEEPVEWVDNDFLQEMPERVSITLEGRLIQLMCWKYEAIGVTNYRVNVYFLDSDLPENVTTIYVKCLFSIKLNRCEKFR